MMTLMAVMIAIAANAQYNTNYYNQYGGSIGSSTTRSNYSGGYTTNYYNQYGGSTGCATTRSNYSGGTTTNYYNQYGGSTGSATTRSYYGGGTTTNYYDQYGGSTGSATTVPTMVAVQPQTTMISMVVVSVRQLPDRTMAVEPPQPITTNTVVTSDQVPAGKEAESDVNFPRHRSRTSHKNRWGH